MSANARQHSAASAISGTGVGVAVGGTPHAPPADARHSTRPAAKKRATFGCSGLCDGPLPDSLLADFSDCCVACVSSRRANCLCCLLCRQRGFFHFLHCRRVRATPPRVDAELRVLYFAAAEHDIITVTARTLYRAPPQLSAFTSSASPSPSALTCPLLIGRNCSHLSAVTITRPRAARAINCLLK